LLCNNVLLTLFYWFSDEEQKNLLKKFFKKREKIAIYQTAVAVTVMLVKLRVERESEKK
jgi:hypothetical protein